MVLRGGVKRLPRASMVHGWASSPSNSMGVMRRILPSLTKTKHGPAVGVARVAAHAAALVGAELEAGVEHHLQRLREPHCEVIGALDAHLEVLERVDELQVVAGRLQQARGHLCRVEDHRQVRSASAGRRVSGPCRSGGLEGPSAGLAGQADLRDQVPLAKARGEVPGGVRPWSSAGPRARRASPRTASPPARPSPAARRPPLACASAPTCAPPCRAGHRRTYRVTEYLFRLVVR